MTNQTGNLSVRELLTQTHELLRAKHGGQAVVFSRPVHPEIANDSDWHRTRTGHMKYESADVITIGGRRWAIARGEAWGSYPADPYDSDLVAIPLDGDADDVAMAETVGRAIAEGTYFRNTLVFGMSDGRLACARHGRFTEKVLRLVGPRADDLIASDVRRDESLLSASTLQPVVTSAMQYRPDAASILVTVIETVLTSSR